jgi:poly-gamma-glutamate capsule biosynthesis protein CapA/YwtB (metallophosphatase superfamily)
LKRPLLPLFTASLVVLPLLAQVALLAQENRVDLGEFTMTLVGDNNIVTRATTRQNSPKFMAVVNEIRLGDARVANLETTFPGSKSFPSGPPRGDNLISDPGMLKELQWMGFNMFGTANNHSLDWGIQGLLDTIDVLNQGGAVHAGTGENLGAARAPAYLDTPHGRVALITCASTFPPDSPAGQARPDMRGRPGISPLRYQTRYRVTAPQFEALRKIGEDLKIASFPGTAGTPPAGPQTLNLAFKDTLGVANVAGTATFEVSDKPGVVTTADPGDLAAITHSIRDGKELADYVVASIHAHEGLPGQAPGFVELPAQFLVEYAHAAVDAGADVFVGSGPHVLRGIEIYKGKVILYSLGNFITENWLMVPQSATMYERFNLGLEALPSEVHNTRSDHGRKDEPSYPLYWQTAIARVVFRNSRPAEVKITPVTLGFKNRSVNRGYPELAAEPEATQILQHLQELSAPFGTKIAINNGIGTITIGR